MNYSKLQDLVEGREWHVKFMGSQKDRHNLVNEEKHIHIHMCVCVYIYTHTYIYIYIQFHYLFATPSVVFPVLSVDIFVYSFSNYFPN